MAMTKQKVSDRILKIANEINLTIASGVTMRSFVEASVRKSINCTKEEFDQACNHILGIARAKIKVLGEGRSIPA